MVSPAVPADKKFRVLVVGGSYAGLSTAMNLLDLCRGRPARMSAEDNHSGVKIPIEVTIADERDGFYHLVGSPLALLSRGYADKAWVKFDEIPALQSPSIRYIRGSVKTVDIETKTATFAGDDSEEATHESYDFLVAASGLRRVWPVVPQSLDKDGYLQEVENNIQAVSASNKGVVVVGGGAVGIEIATEMKVLYPTIKVTLAHSRERLLSSEPLPDDVKAKALELARDAGVEILLKHRVDKVDHITEPDGSASNIITFTNREEITAGYVVNAISRAVPSTSYLPEQFLDESGYARIRADLSVASSDSLLDHFAVGDIARWSGIKRCGAAMHMGHYAAVNIHQLMLRDMLGHEPKLMELPEIPPMIALAVGNSAIAYGPQGMGVGKEVSDHFFGNDMALKGCWDQLGLSQAL
ncbi:Apoptosis-inducing factor 2 [Pleurostoma richardsiae]|uniref:Apoptosis-inducing factor 2 n=1 Tax=Pleurostoma richardsiae TaxID=41990 RepID=A0AA38RT91_9PEZI|nr:Apoptosis-inducing factor 2 [Pleurostoma richardsiae]